MELMKAVKNCDAEVEQLVSRMISQAFSDRREMVSVFEDRPVLVPVPRASPLRYANSAWPARWICEKLVRPVVARFVRAPKVVPLLKRKSQVPPARTGMTSQRRVSEHDKSLDIDQKLLKRLLSRRSKMRTIVIVDDIITSGNTVMAAAWHVKRHIPDADVRAFAVFRTVRPLIQELLFDPVVGKVRYDRNSDWCTREP